MANDTKIKIGGRTITLSGSESAEYMKQVADYLNGKRNSFSEDSSFWNLPEDMKNIMIQLNLADDYFKVKDQVTELENRIRDMEKDHAGKVEEVRRQAQEELENTLQRTQDEKLLEIESLKKQLSEARTQLIGNQTIMKQLQGSLAKERARSSECETALRDERAAIQEKEQRLSADMKRMQDNADKLRAELARRKSLCEQTVREIDALTQSKARLDAAFQKLQEVRENL